ncbi:hypothetical protein BH09PSE2_BH09PSE2_14780 [soil metagenome]
MQTGDIVLKLTLRTLEEAEAFSAFLTRFLDGWVQAVDRLTAPAEPPFLMVTSEPAVEADIRIVTFDQPALAAAFASGWDRVRTGGARALLRI